VAVIGPTYPIRGGISHYTTLMVEALRLDHDVLFVSFLKQYPALLFPGHTQVDDSEKPIRTNCERLISFSNPVSWRRAARRIVQYAPDLLIMSWVNPALSFQFRYITGYVKRRSPRTRVVFWCHNVVQHERLPMNARLTRVAFKRADHFIVTCRESERNLHEMRQGSRISLAYLPALDFFSDSGASRESSRERIGLDAGAKVALYFGFVRAYKGLGHLLDAMPEAASRVPGLHLLIVGEFWEERGPYEDAVRRNGLVDRVTIVDRYIPNEEVAFYFNSADMVVLPYVTASGSGIVQVAYSFGKPVLTTNVGSLPEVVEDGKTGYLVEPGDPGAIAGAMVDFFESGRGEEFSRNITELRGRFSWERFVEVIESLA
jgi:glycosyltransferase involved in cell wall biosynthesis